MSGHGFHVHGPHDHELEHASQGGHGHGDSGMTNQIAMFTAIIATVGAIFGYMAGATQANAGLYKNNAAIKKTEASNQWNYYQAKSSKQNLSELALELAPAGKKDFYQEEIKRYKTEKAEIKAAAEYFGAMKWSQWMKVIETDTVPKTRVANGMFLKLESNEKEPLGQRVIETPIDAEATEVLRDARSGYEVYVPVGSVKKGKALVKTGAGKTTACGICHGADLKGMGPVPGLAGRSPSYLSRQMYDMQNGFRKGQWTELMKPVVAKLSDDDMIAISAYLGGWLTPRARHR